MFEALKSLSPKQRFLGFIIVVFISAATSLGTAYMNGSDCTDISDKYTKSVENYNKSIENYNKLIVITDETQKKYMGAKEDIIIIQERLNELYEILGQRSMKTKSEKSRSYRDDELNSTNPFADKGKYPYMDTMKVMTTSPWIETKKITIKEKVTITKTESPKEAKSMIDSILRITKKYDKKK